MRDSPELCQREGEFVCPFFRVNVCALVLVDLRRRLKIYEEKSRDNKNEKYEELDHTSREMNL